MSAEQAKLETLIGEAREQLITPYAVHARFDGIANSQYSANMGHWIPDYEYAHTLLLDALALHLPAHAAMLELGAGTGRVSELILRRFPDSHITLVDFSPNMI